MGRPPAGSTPPGDWYRCSTSSLVVSGGWSSSHSPASCRGADFRDQIHVTQESADLRAVSDGFPLVARDDRESVERAAFLYAARWASLRKRRSGGAS